MTMSAGKYWIGDLCYVMHKEWDEVCDITIDGKVCKSGEFTLNDGRRFAIYGTAHGDGVYFDKEQRDYGVDSGTIGCILVSDINEDEILDGGHIVDFPKEFNTYSRTGVIYFGDLGIDTDPDLDCVEDEYYEDDEEM